MGIAICTRNHNWDNDQYQRGVIQPYRKVQELQESIEREGREASFDEMKIALDMLLSVFRTKKTPVKEQVERFNQLFNETGTRHLFGDFEMPVE